MVMAALLILLVLYLFHVAPQIKQLHDRPARPTWPPQRRPKRPWTESTNPLASKWYDPDIEDQDWGRYQDEVADFGFSPDDDDVL